MPRCQVQKIHDATQALHYLCTPDNLEWLYQESGRCDKRSIISQLAVCCGQAMDGGLHHADALESELLANLGYDRKARRHTVGSYCEKAVKPRSTTSQPAARKPRMRPAIEKDRKKKNKHVRKRLEQTMPKPKRCIPPSATFINVMVGGHAALVELLD